MSMSASGNAGSVAEINVTPLIDVLLVLLIIFMVIVPAASNGMSASVPQPAKDATATADPKTIVVSVLAGEGGAILYKINETAFAKADIEPELASIFAGRQDRQIFVKGDKELTFTTISELIDDAHRAGVDRIGILTPGSQAAR